VSPTASGLC